MSERFYLPAIGGDQAVLAGSEAHHLIHVMRAKVGLNVVLFDGRGAEFPAQISQIGRTEVRLSVGPRADVDRELGVDITLGVALPKGDRQRWLVEKAVELGVRCLLPLMTERGVAQPGGAALERLRRAIVEASKQCGRNRLMEIDDPCPFSQFVAAAPGEKPAETAVNPLIADSKEVSPGEVRWIAHRGGQPVGELFGDASDAVGPAPAYLLAVGPEGGFTDEEASCALRAGWQPVDLGPRTLRIETAALALAAAIATRWPGG